MIGRLHIHVHPGRHITPLGLRVRWREAPRLRGPLLFEDRHRAWREANPPAAPTPDTQHRIRITGGSGPAAGLYLHSERGLPGFEAARGSAGKQRSRIPRSAACARSLPGCFAPRTTTGKVQRPLRRACAREPSDHTALLAVWAVLICCVAVGSLAPATSGTNCNISARTWHCRCCS